MRISYDWLQDYIDAPLPSPETIEEALTMHAFEVESVERADDDHIFEIAVLPNRSHDCLSYAGIAREVATLLNLPLKIPQYAFEGDASVSTAKHVSLAAPDPKLVRRAMKRLATDVQVGESPEWLKKKLAAHGQRSINNIVDATNFVMWETGQPVHAFDYDKLAGDGVKEISIRPAAQGEKITTLDGKEFELDENMLVIADTDKALDIAGVKGGAVSGIDEGTKRVLLSACTFHPTSIRKTSRALNLLTDASKRFEQEISPVLAERGLARLSELLVDIAGAKVAADVVDIYPRKRNPYYVGVSVAEANALLGAELADDEFETILTRMGFAWEKVRPREKVLAEAQKMVGMAYTYGASISYDAPRTFDCSSFVAYVFARAGIAVPRVTADQFLFGIPVAKEELRPGDLVFALNDHDGEAKDVTLIATGETIKQKVRHTKTVDYMKGTDIPEGVDHDGIYLGDGKIIHASGMWHKGSVVIEDLDETPAFKNIRGYRRIIDTDEERYVVTAPPERLDLHAGPGFMISGTSADLIEEIGRVYGYEKIAPHQPSPAPVPVVNKTFYYTQKIRDILVGLGFSEVMTYAFQADGDVALANPLAEDKKYLRENLVDGLEKSLELNARNAPLVGSHAVKIFEIGTVFEKEREYLQLGITASDPKAAEAAFEAIDRAFGEPLPTQGRLADLSAYIETLPEPGMLDDLVAMSSDVRFAPISIYPFVLRDIAVWVPDAVANDILEVVKKEAGELFVRGDQFDSFSKDGKTSYAYHLVFQSQEKTLSDEEVNVIMARVMDALNSREGWKVR